jgi:hypothetical protein
MLQAIKAVAAAAAARNTQHRSKTKTKKSERHSLSPRRGRPRCRRAGNDVLKKFKFLFHLQIKTPSGCRFIFCHTLSNREGNAFKQIVRNVTGDQLIFKGAAL